MGEIDFSLTYGAHKSYDTPTLLKKHIRRFDHEFWTPGPPPSGASVLDVGCGPGMFLLYLLDKGIEDFVGVDPDPALPSVMPSEVADRFRNASVWDFLETEAGPYDRITMWDVFEHFAPDDGAKLMGMLRDRLKPGGRIVLRVPNAESPWGLKAQFGDLTHRAPYTPTSMRQLAGALGLAHVAFLDEGEGSKARRAKQKALGWFLDRFLVTPPDIWSGNFVAVLERGKGA